MTRRDFSTITEGNSTKVIYDNQVVVGEITSSNGVYIARDYRAVREPFTFKSLAVGWIIARARRRKSREKLYKNGQSEKLKLFTCITE